MDVLTAKADAKNSNNLFLAVMCVFTCQDLEELGEFKSVALNHDVWAGKHWLYNFMLGVIDRRRREIKAGNNSAREKDRDFFERLIDEADWAPLIYEPSDDDDPQHKRDWVKGRD